MKRRLSSLAIGDRVQHRAPILNDPGIVVAVEPLDPSVIRVTLFADGRVEQFDNGADEVVSAESPPMLLEALQALSDLYEQVVSTPSDRLPSHAQRQAVDLMAKARRLGIMTRFESVYTVRK